MSSAIDVPGFAPIAIGFMLMGQVFSFGYISGGHFNPAVTLGVYLIGELKLRRSCFYVLAQLLGGLCAALIGWVLLDNPDMLQPPQPQSNSSNDIFRAVLSEILYTSCLVSVVLHVACSRQRDNNHYGLAIGMTVLASAFAVGKISGGAFNPAVATALHLQKIFAPGATVNPINPVQYLWIYWLGSILGAGLAALTFKIVHAVESEEKAIYNREEAGSAESHESMNTI